MIQFEVPRPAQLAFLRKGFTINEVDEFLNPVTKAGYAVYTFVDYYGGQPVSMCRANLLGKDLHITYLLVDSRYRGLGFATDMIKELKKFCARNDLHRLTANTRLSNEVMQALLRSQGFCYRDNGAYTNKEQKIKFIYDLERNSRGGEQETLQRSLNDPSKGGTGGLSDISI